jgi:hypothetical protein
MRAAAGDHLVEILGSEKTHCFLQLIVDRPRDLIFFRASRVLAHPAADVSSLVTSLRLLPVCKNNAGQKQLWLHIIAILLSRIKGITQKSKPWRMELLKKSVLGVGVAFPKA